MQGNLGDDLMVRVLCERYPKIRFLIYADEAYKERYGDLPNVKVYSPTDRISQYMDRIVWKVKKTDRGMWKLLVKLADVTVYIGGSIFVQHFDDFRNVYGDLELAMRSNKAYVIGANFGPYTDEKFYESYYNEVFHQYEDVCFRDIYSKGLFPEHKNIRYAPDVVFNYQMPENVQEKKQVLFSVISLDEREGKFPLKQYAQVYYDTMAKLAEIFIKKGYVVKFVSFCKFQNDEDAVTKIVDKISEDCHDSVTKLLYDKNHKEVVQAFAESELVVGTRFHSIILGWLAGKKVLPVVYDHKIRKTLKDNQQEFYIEMSELESMTEEKLKDIADKLIAQEYFYSKNLVCESDKQFEALDKFLN